MNIKITTIINGTTWFVAKREDTSEYIGAQIEVKNNGVEDINFEYYIGVTSSINDVADLLIELGKSMKTDKNQ